MGLIGKIVRSQVEDGIREIVTELFKDYTRRSYQICPPGIDANPLPDDQGVLIMIDENPGKSVQIGVLPKQSVKKGEIRLYSRDENGEIKAIVHLKDDGEIEVSNDNGGLTLKPDGDIELNGDDDNAVRFSKLKDVIKEIQDDIGDLKDVFTNWSPVSQDGGAALKSASGVWAGTALTKDIDDAKIDNIKVPEE
ncbi:MAG: hypothetical protein KA369_08300 [Spirochaetes bacterium]|nr:hypothetical protein [Spirochaetota bacterium]